MGCTSLRTTARLGRTLGSETPERFPVSSLTRETRTSCTSRPSAHSGRRAASATATQTVSGTIAAATLALSVTASVHTQAGVAYSQTSATTGGTGPYTFALSAGSLPAGLTLNTSTGTVSGTPTWSSNQAITLSTAAQPNVTSVGTLTGLTVSGQVTFQNNLIIQDQTPSSKTLGVKVVAYEMIFFDDNSSNFGKNRACQ